MTKWHDDASNLDIVAFSAITEKRIIDAECCANPQIHIHAHRGCFSSKRKDKGGIWVWCSNCGAFSHIDGVSIPADWSNNSDVDFSKLSAVPNYLDTVKNSVDEHYEGYMFNKH